jgi:hypothetical protein
MFCSSSSSELAERKAISVNKMVPREYEACETTHRP